ncbi:MAG: BamA/TamA family outer membrane protein [Deltaproteobacteria bacterium]|nr:BamA/TamA family outer membrane protein [Deltaproteobacteria bacterium]
MRLVVAFLIALAATRVHADALHGAIDPADPPRKVVGFALKGKTKLKLRVLPYLAHLEVGDYVRERDRPKIKRALISWDLFATAEVTYEESPGGVVVVATLKDRHSWLIAPTFYLQSGKRSLGVGYVDSNFRGLNQKAVMYGQIGERDNLVFGTFLDDNVKGTDLIIRTDFYAYSKLIDEYVNPEDDATSTEIGRTARHNYVGGGFLLGWNCEWWCKIHLRQRLAYVYFNDAQAPDGSPLPNPSTDGWDVTSQLWLNFDLRQQAFGVRWGPYIQLMGETTIPGLDDYDYSSALLRAYYSWILFRTHQFELRTNFQVGRHLPIHEELVTGGVTDIRGYALDQFRGDARMMFRAEYSVPLVQFKGLRFRGIGFYDRAYIGFHSRNPDGRRDYLPTQSDGASWTRSNVGVGLRLYVGWIVVPVLGLDVAYGLESKATQLVFEVGFTDF